MICRTRGESVDSVVHNKGIHYGFETQDRFHQKSEIGVSVVSHKGQISSNLFISVCMSMPDDLGHVLVDKLSC